MREQLHTSLKKILFVFFLITAFILPFKFGIPYMEQESFLFPFSVWEWGVLPYWPNEFFTLSVLFLALVWLLTFAIDPKRELIWNVPLTCFSLFIAWSFFGMLYSAYPYATKLVSEQFLAYFLLFFLAIQLSFRDPRLIKQVVFVLIGSSLVIALLGLHQHFFSLQATLDWLQQGGAGEEAIHHNVLSRLKGGRAFGTFIYPNSLAGFLLLSIPLSIALVVSQTKKVHQLVLMVIPLILILCLGVTFSKGAFIAALFAFVIYFIWHKREKHPTVKHRTLWNGIAVVFFAFVFYYHDFILHRLDMPTLSYRFDYWIAGLKMILNYPIAGSGLGTYGVLYPLFKSVEAQDTQLAHNDYLEIVTETGAIGFILLAIAFIYIFIKGLKNLHQQPLLNQALFWGLFAIGLHHFVDFDLFVAGIGGWEFVLLGLFAAHVIPIKKIAWPRFTPILSFGVILLLFFIQSNLLDQLSAKYAFDLSIQSTKNKEYSKALELIEKAIEKEPLNATYSLTKGNLYLKLNQPQKAIESFKQAASKNKPWAAPYILQTQYRLKEWQKTKSEEAYSDLVTIWKKAVNRMPAKVNERVKLARFLEKNGHLEEALLEYRAVLSKLPHNKEIQNKCRVLGQELSKYFKDQA